MVKVAVADSSLSHHRQIPDGWRNNNADAAASARTYAHTCTHARTRTHTYTIVISRPVSLPVDK